MGKSLHRLNFPVLTSSFRPLFDLPDAPSAVPPTMHDAACHVHACRHAAVCLSGAAVDAYVTSNKPLILWEYVKGYQDDIGNTYENHYRKTITKAAYAKVSVSLNRQGVVRDPDAFASSIPHKPGDCYVDVLHDGQFKLILKSTGGPLADFPCYKPKKVLLSLNKCG